MNAQPGPCHRFLLTGRPESMTVHTLGVNVIADLTLEGGLGESTRSTIDALLRRGISVSICEWAESPCQRPHPAGSRYSHLPRGVNYPITLLLCNINEVSELPIRRLREVTAGTYTIGNWVWELPTVPRPWHAHFVCVNELWVPSRHVRDARRLVTDSPVLVIPRPVDTTPAGAGSRASLGLPADRYIFL